MRRKRCHKNRQSDGVDNRLRVIRNPLKVKNISTHKVPVVRKPLLRMESGSCPKPPRSKEWEKITRTASISRQRQKALFRASNRLPSVGYVCRAGAISDSMRAFSKHTLHRQTDNL